MINIDVYLLSPLLIVNSNYPNKNAYMLLILLDHSKHNSNHKIYHIA